MVRRHTVPFNSHSFLAQVGDGKTVLTFQKKEPIFSQGDAADAVFYIQEGVVKLTVVSKQGKEAVLTLLEANNFFGESCLARQTVRMATATAHEASIIMRIDKTVMLRVLQDDPTFAELFLTHILTHNVRVEADLVDHLFNSSEKRLARTLLLLAHVGKEGSPDAVIAKVSQETLAEMIGTTRSRVSFFMNKFRKLGFIDYNGSLRVHRSLMNILVRD